MNHPRKLKNLTMISRIIFRILMKIKIKIFLLLKNQMNLPTFSITSNKAQLLTDRNLISYNNLFKIVKIIHKSCQSKIQYNFKTPVKARSTALKKLKENHLNNPISNFFLILESSHFKIITFHHKPLIILFLHKSDKRNKKYSIPPKSLSLIKKYVQINSNLNNKSSILTLYQPLNRIMICMEWSMKVLSNKLMIFQCFLDQSSLKNHKTLKETGFIILKRKEKDLLRKILFRKKYSHHLPQRTKKCRRKKEKEKMFKWLTLHRSYENMIIL